MENWDEEIDNKHNVKMRIPQIKQQHRHHLQSRNPSECCRDSHYPPRIPRTPLLSINIQLQSPLQSPPSQRSPSSS